LNQGFFFRQGTPIVLYCTSKYNNST